MRVFVILGMIALIFALIQPAVSMATKRPFPPKVKPIQVNGVTYSTKSEHLNIGFKVFLVAFRGKKQIWKSELFRHTYGDEKPMGLQFIALTSLRYEAGTLLVEDEQKRIYRVNSETGALIIPEKPHDYTEP